MKRSLASALALLGFLQLSAARADETRPAADWPSYGRDVGGSRYSPLDEITPANVSRLKLVWSYRFGESSDGSGDIPSTTAAEATPILVDGTLYYCTPFNRVIALDPETGEERWAFDPKVDVRGGNYANQLVCRGLSTWVDPEREAGAACRRRIFMGTNDARLIAVDAASGERCGDFGKRGEVDLNPGVGEQRWRGEYQVTSPPAVAAGLVIVGSAVGDNDRVNAPSGVVRAYDARTGALRWAWDLSPPDFVPTDENTSAAGYALGSPNVWAPMAVDSARGLVFVPTGNPAPDYFRGDSNIDYYGSSVVALDAGTGEVAWSFQTVHRDLWDFDVPHQPTLFEWKRGPLRVPALIQGTKMGLLFVLHRESGEPLFPVEERPVPQVPVASGETLSPTQPFPLKPPPLVPTSLKPEDAWGVTPWDRGACREALAALRFQGMYTPPTVEGTLMIPGNAGGVNWGGLAVDPERQLAVVNTQNLAWAVKLIPRQDFDRVKAEHPDSEVSPQSGTPYGMKRDLVMSPLGLPCTPPPWGELAAVDLAKGEIRWQVPLGTIRDVTPIPLPIKLGVPNLGGPLVTKSGLVFIGASLGDDSLRAFDVETGEELWLGRLPAGGIATPMTYRVRDGGRQYVVISAGGYGRGTGRVGDWLVAFALP